MKIPRGKEGGTPIEDFGESLRGRFSLGLKRRHVYHVVRSGFPEKEIFLGARTP
jgi:hypothetical protein